MAVQILAYNTSPFNQQRVYTLLCDTVSDLPSGTYDGVSITQGWTAKIIENGATYLSNSSGAWILQPSQQSQIILPDVYDKTETDNLLAPIIDDITDIQDVDTRQDGVLEDLINTGAKNLLQTNASSGTRFVNIPVVLQPGVYHIYFGEITSTDTDAQTCQFAAFASDNSDASNYLQLQRVNGVNGVLTVTKTTSYVRLYASNTYANSTGDTVTFSDAMLCTEDAWKLSQDYIPYCPTLQEVYEHKAAVSFTPGGTIGNILNCTFTIPDSSRTLRFTIGKLNATQNYLQVYVNGVDKGYIVFDVSRNIDNWGE